MLTPDQVFWAAVLFMCVVIGTLLMVCDQEDGTR